MATEETQLLVCLIVNLATGAVLDTWHIYRRPAFWRITPVISLPILALIWLLFLFIRYTKTDALVKAGIRTSVMPFSLLRVSMPHIVRSAGPDSSKPQYQGHWHIHIRRSEATLL